jgi:peroxiredoxin
MYYSKTKQIAEFIWYVDMYQYEAKLKCGPFTLQHQICGDDHHKGIHTLSNHVPSQFEQDYQIHLERYLGLSQMTNCCNNVNTWVWPGPCAYWYTVYLPLSGNVPKCTHLGTLTDLYEVHVTLREEGTVKMIVIVQFESCYCSISFQNVKDQDTKANNFAIFFLV